MLLRQFTVAPVVAVPVTYGPHSTGAAASTTAGVSGKPAFPSPATISCVADAGSTIQSRPSKTAKSETYAFIISPEGENGLDGAARRHCDLRAAGCERRCIDFIICTLPLHAHCPTGGHGLAAAGAGCGGGYNAVMPALRSVPAPASAKFSKGAVLHMEITPPDDRPPGWGQDITRIDLIAPA
jgi:hypothetical protein